MSVDPGAPVTGDPAISNIERLLCAPAVAGAIDTLLPRSADAWSMQLTGLDVFAEQDALAERDGQVRPLRICIATEQITGPVRNGGIGSTYASLALLLADAGFDVTVLYLRGQLCETETIEHWVDHYAARGVTLVPVPDYGAADRFASNSDRWLRGPYNMMRWLIDHPMDVVHVSEWRGSGYLCLLARRQGIAFADTLFVVKTSSPWMWNRMYGGHALDKAEDLVKIHAERCSVEMADVVVGGSLHLLRWMSSQGYAVPRERAFVQPNVVTFTALEPLITRRALPHGQRTPIDEFVFFGRLESRKGLFVFCQAIRRLIRKGVPLPAKITFMGKPGSRMASHPDQDTPDYIAETSQDWPTEVQVLTNFQQYEAVEYLLGGKRLAVMPSIIENSSLAIYEAAICAIPTVATNVGGNAELIVAADHAAVLCEPHPVSLGDRLEEALALGGMVPTPSFDNNANLETWRSFHRQLRGPLRRQLLDASLPPAGDARPVPDALGGTSIGIYYTGDAAALEDTLASLARLAPPAREVLVGVDAASNADCDVASALLEQYGFGVPDRDNIVEAFDLDAGPAFNRMAERATGDHLLFLWEGGGLQPGALGRLGGVAGRTGAQVLNYLYRVVDPANKGNDPLCAHVMVGVADSFFRTDAREMPLFIDRATFLRLGGFTPDYRVLGHDHEFVAKAQLAGVPCQTVMAELGSIQARSGDWLRLRGYDLSASSSRAIRPKLAATPLAMRDTLLLARGMHARGPIVKLRSNPDPVVNPEGLLARMLVGLKHDDAEPPRGKSAARKPAKAAKPAFALPASKIPLRAIERESVNALRQMTVKPKATGTRPARSESRAIPEAKAAAPAKLRPSPSLAALLATQDAASDSARVGQVLGSHGNQLYGWVARLGSPGETLTVELIVDGNTSARQTQPANRLFAPFAALPDEAARHGFVIDLPIIPARAGGGIAWAVAVSGCDLVLGEGLVLPQNAALRSGGIEAGCEPDMTGIIRGWARATADPARKLDIALFANGVFMGRCRADQPRDDGAAGFAMPVPALLRKGGRHRIDVLIADLGLSLPGPLWVEGAQVAIAPARTRTRKGAA